MSQKHVIRHKNDPIIFFGWVETLCRFGAKAVVYYQRKGNCSQTNDHNPIVNISVSPSTSSIICRRKCVELTGSLRNMNIFNLILFLVPGWSGRFSIKWAEKRAGEQSFVTILSCWSNTIKMLKDLSKDTLEFRPYSDVNALESLA